MSWIDKVKDGMTIAITDGSGVKVFTPDWMNASFQTEYNYTEFNFIDVGGSYVIRKKPLGAKYSLELYFQGPDHLEIAADFRKKCDNTQDPWIIKHPMYDQLIVQITSLNYDNTLLNVTKITGTVIETMEQVPISNLFRSAIDEVPILSFEVAEVGAKSFTEIPAPEDINTMAKDNATSYKKGVPIISDALDFETYHNAFNTAANYINTATATPLLAMRSLIEVIQLPGNFKAEVQQRLKVLITTFDSLRANIFGLVKVSSKQIFAAEQAATIGAICTAACSPIGSGYKNKNEVLNIIAGISARYGQFIDDLDALQNSNAGSPLSFVVDADLMFSLNALVNTAIEALYKIANTSLSERSFICEKDTNVIILTHRLYGLDANDENINQLMENNDMGINELLQVAKGRKIVYYV